MTTNSKDNPLVGDTLLGTVQNVSEALSAFTMLLGQNPECNNTCKLLQPILDALEYEADK